MIRVLILDVTEMSGPNVCVAGLDVEALVHVRLSHPQPTRQLLAKLGGLVPGDLIEVEWRPLPRLEPPHREDGLWKLSTVRKLEHLGAVDVLRIVEPTSFTSVEGAFGPPAIQGANGNHAWSAGRGDRSLATVRVRYTRLFEQDGRPRVAFRDADGAYFASVPMQDLIVKTHPDPCDDCRSRYLDQLKAEFDSNAGLLRLGLTRPFGNTEAETGCWLQVTNVLSVERKHFC